MSAPTGRWAAPTPEPTSARVRRYGLAALLGGMAVLHVVRPEPFEAIIPDWVPGDPAVVNLLATAAEGGSALLMANRRTARLGGWAALATFLGVYPANIQMALDGTPLPGTEGFAASRTALWLRLPLQLPLLWWSWRTARSGTTVGDGDEGSAATP